MASIVLAAAFLALGTTPYVAAQEEPPPPAPVSEQKAAKTPEARPERPARPAPTANLRVQLVISRHRNEKKTASLPYTFNVTAGGERTRLRMGVETPVPTGPGGSFAYKTVGTNIDCTARDLGSGVYQLWINLDNTSAAAGEKSDGDVPTTGGPLFRRFETGLNVLLRSGQTIQTVASTDPVTGEVVRIDVTMNVVK
jgi:hypothetical protein